jgi:hypothetical protein
MRVGLVFLEEGVARRCEPKCGGYGIVEIYEVSTLTPSCLSIKLELLRSVLLGSGRTLVSPGIVRGEWFH